MGGLLAVWALLMLPLCLRSSQASQEPRLMTKVEVEVLPRPGASTREREIAAVFRGVAYGALATRPPNSTTAAAASAAAPPDEVLKVSSTTAAATAPPGNESIRWEDPPPDSSSSRVQQVKHETSNGTESTRRVDVVAANTGSPPVTTDGGGKREGNNASGSATPTSEEEGGGGRGGGGGGGGGGGVRPDTAVESEDLRVSLGLAWWLQVYLSAGLYTLLAITSLCLMARAAAASRLLPRPHYLSLHVLVFLSAFSRGLYILQDAHTVEHLLPAAISTAVEDMGWPCLTAALAVMVVGVLRAWHYPSRRPCAALTIALVTVAHLVSLPVTHLVSGLLKPRDLPILPTARVVAVTWGGAVGVAGLWAVWVSSRCSSSPHLTEMGGGSVRDNPGSTRLPANFVLTAAVMQLLLFGFNLYLLVVPESPPEWAWAWWCRLGLSRGLEILMGGTLLAAAALTLNQLAHCALNCYCCHKRTVEVVHPSSIKMIHPLGVYTLQQALPKNEHAQTIAALSLGNHSKVKRDHKSLDYVTSDFQLVWSHATRPLASSQTASRFDDDFLQLGVDKEQERSRAHVLPKTPQDAVKPFVGADVFTCSLPTYKLYATPESCYQYDEDVKALQELGITRKGPTAYSCGGSSSSGGGGGGGGGNKLYSSPQVPLRASRSWDELSTSHIYEEPQRTTCGSVDEALSDLSDMAGVSDISDMAVDYPSDVGYGDTRSPLRVPRKRLTTAHYVGGKHFNTAKLPSTNVAATTAEPIPTAVGQQEYAQMHNRAGKLQAPALHHHHNKHHSGGLNFT